MDDFDILYKKVDYIVKHASWYEMGYCSASPSFGFLVFVRKSTVISFWRMASPIYFSFFRMLRTVCGPIGAPALGREFHSP